MLNFEKMNGLIPAIVQDCKTNKVLMLGFMSKEAWQKTQKTGKATFFSRTRNRLWTKGEISGNSQIIKEILVDCDNDAVLLRVEQRGGACHEGYKSCFFRKLEDNELKIIEKQIFDPKEVYKNE